MDKHLYPAIDDQGRLVYLTEQPTPLATFARIWYEAKQAHKIDPTPRNALAADEAYAKLW